MAYDRIIDSGALDSGLTAVADALRARSGTGDKLDFPEGFVAAVERVQPKTVSLTLKSKNTGYTVHYFDDGVYKKSSVYQSDDTNGTKRVFSMPLGSVIAVFVSYSTASGGTNLVSCTNEKCAVGRFNISYRVNKSYIHAVFLVQVTEEDGLVEITYTPEA